MADKTVAVMADVHGNLPALEAVLADAREHGAKAFVAAGDLTLGGPYPLATFNRLREIGCWMIRGNSEQYLLDFTAGRFPALAHTSQQWAPLRYTAQQFTAEALGFLGEVRENAIFALDDAQPARVVHGSPRRINEGLIPDGLPDVVRLFESATLTHQFQNGNANLSAVWQGVEESVFICGHTHIGWVEEKDGRLALNPGSVGAPINGDWRAQYALLHWNGVEWKPELRAVPYDLDALRRAYESTGFRQAGGAFARAFLLTDETGLNVAWFLVVHVMQLAEDMNVDISDGFPDELWSEAVRTFDWQSYENQR